MNKIKHNIKYNINEQSKTEALCFLHVSCMFTAVHENYAFSLGHLHVSQ